jgi:hypothetical protein
MFNIWLLYVIVWLMMVIIMVNHGWSWISIVMGVPPIAGWFIMDRPMSKWMVWGYSHFRKPPWGFLKSGIPQTMGFNTKMVIHDLDDFRGTPCFGKPPYLSVVFICLSAKLVKLCISFAEWCLTNLESQFHGVYADTMTTLFEDLYRFIDNVRGYLLYKLNPPVGLLSWYMTNVSL